VYQLASVTKLMGGMTSYIKNSPIEHLAEHLPKRDATAARPVG